MKKTIFFFAILLFYSCSKQAPSSSVPPSRPMQTATCDSCEVLKNYEKLPQLEIYSSDWVIDSSGGYKKDLGALYEAAYPWEFGAGRIRWIVINHGTVNQKAIKEGESFDIFGGSLSLNENEIQFRGALSLLPDTLRLAVAF